VADDPAVVDALAVRVLRGLSGARVLLMTKDKRHWFVRKIVKDPANNERLRRQIAKQRDFSTAVASIVRTPAIVQEGEIEGRYYVDMEFIRGADGVTFLRHANRADLVGLADRLCEYLCLVATLPAATANSGSLFEALYGKLCEVQSKTSLLDGPTLARMFTALDSVRRLEGPACTLCHGDLTLENLVIDNRLNIWMIDLLDAPFEHYWQDVAKLHQDLEGGWYQLSQPRIAKYVLEYMSSRVVATATALTPQYTQIHAILLASTFVRILPYARTEREQQFVKQRVEHFARLAHGEVR